MDDWIHILMSSDESIETFFFSFYEGSKKKVYYVDKIVIPRIRDVLNFDISESTAEVLCLKNALLHHFSFYLVILFDFSKFILHEKPEFCKLAILIYNILMVVLLVLKNGKIWIWLLLARTIQNWGFLLSNCPINTY